MTTNRILLLGPISPPVGGATRNVELFLRETAVMKEVETVLINTSPGDYRKQTNLLRIDTIHRFFCILIQLLRHASRCDVILVIGRASFIFSLGMVTIVLNQWYRKKLFIKPLGGDFSDRLSRHRFSRNFTRLLQRTDGIFAQTKAMTRDMQAAGLPKTIYMPGYRPAVKVVPAYERANMIHAGPLKLIYVGQIKAEKGVFVILKSLQKLTEESDLAYTCSFYGPVFVEDRLHFERELRNTPSAIYEGVAELDEILEIMSKHDILVFPSFHENEGHPGVIIEAMQVGLPVIGSDFQAIGELIVSGENGLLIPIQDVKALTEALKKLGSEPELRKAMGRRHYQRRYEFAAEKVIDNMVAEMLK